MIVVEPPATALTVNVLPEVVTVATAVMDDEAAKLRLSPSGSVKFETTSTVKVSPAVTEISEIVPIAVGAWFGTVTVTSKLCDASRPPGSVAVTVTVAMPSATPVTVTAEPETLAVARPVSDDVAV